MNKKEIQNQISLIIESISQSNDNDAFNSMKKFINSIEINTDDTNQSENIIIIIKYINILLSNKVLASCSLNLKYEITTMIYQKFVQLSSIQNKSIRSAIIVLEANLQAIAPGKYNFFQKEFSSSTDSKAACAVKFLNYSSICLSNGTYSEAMSYSKKGLQAIENTVLSKYSKKKNLDDAALKAKFMNRVEILIGCYLNFYLSQLILEKDPAVCLKGLKNAYLLTKKYFNPDDNMRIKVAMLYSMEAEDRNLFLQKMKNTNKNNEDSIQKKRKEFKIKKNSDFLPLKSHRSVDMNVSGISSKKIDISDSQIDTSISYFGKVNEENECKKLKKENSVLQQKIAHLEQLLRNLENPNPQSNESFLHIAENNSNLNSRRSHRDSSPTPKKKFVTLREKEILSSLFILPVDQPDDSTNILKHTNHEKLITYKDTILSNLVFRNTGRREQSLDIKLGNEISLIKKNSSNDNFIFDRFSPKLDENEQLQFIKVLPDLDINLLLIYHFHKKAQNKGIITLQILDSHLLPIENSTKKILNIDEIKNMLTNFKKKDVYPFYLSYHTMKYVIQFIKYNVAPHILVRSIKNEYQASIISEPEGVIPNFQHTFLEKNMIVSIYVIKHCMCRLVLRDENSKKPIRFDMFVEESLFENFFTTRGVEFLMNKTNANIMSEIIDSIECNGNVAVEPDLDVQQKIACFSNRIGEYEVESLNTYTLSSPEKANSFQTDLINILTQLEKFIKAHFPEYIKNLKIMKNKIPHVIFLKTLKLFEKCVIYSAVESSSHDSINVQLQACFESYAPEKKKVYAYGYSTPTYIDLAKRYGVNINELIFSEKIVLYNLLLMQHSLEIYEKSIPQDDIELYRENALTCKILTQISAKRHFLAYNDYSYPITSTLWGLDNIPFFVTVRMYDIEKQEKIGYLLTIDEKYWRKKFKSPYKVNLKAKNKSQEEIIYDDNYELPLILSKIGWEMIKINFTFLEWTTKKIVSAINVGGKPCRLNCLENIIDPDQIPSVYNRYLHQNRVVVIVVQVINRQSRIHFQN